MKHISILIKPASSLCNLRCKYCFYANVSSLREIRSYGRMKNDITEKMIENIYADLEDGDELTLAFQGGEPTLAGLTYFKNLTRMVEEQEKRVIVHYAIQTNGIVINEQWCQFLKQHNFLVGLSIDGHPLYHDMNRLDPRGRGTFQKVLHTKHLFDQYEIQYNILCVLTEQLAGEVNKVFKFLLEEKIEFVQFIPCLDDLQSNTKHNYGLTPGRFASFYHQLLKLWLAELQKHHYVSVKLFDDIVNLLVHKQVTSCGILGNCSVQYVIEADGSVYPCDFYVLDQFRMGYIQEKTLRELFEQEISHKFMCEKAPLQSYCQKCPFFNICRGGCKRMKDAVYVQEGIDFCGYQSLLKEFIPEIPNILNLLEGAIV